MDITSEVPFFVRLEYAMFDRKIVFEDGTEIFGKGFGYTGDLTAEIVFNTTMAGYQEIMSDPSYKYQAVVMTYPLIGNYGINDEDFESDNYPVLQADDNTGDPVSLRPTLSALITGECCDTPSNFRSRITLEELMLRYGIAGIEGVDTRMLTRIIRDRGSKKVLITDAKTDISECIKKFSSEQLPHDGVKAVSTPIIKEYHPKELGGPHIVAIDCGIKKGIIREFLWEGCSVTLVPWDTPADEIMRRKPDGLFISNGPGDPEDAVPVIETVKTLRGRLPIFGICLGNQIIALAYGASTYKLKFGHRGGNHPVKELRTGKIEITSQNHSYAVNADSIKGTGLEATHINLLDNTVEGIACEADKIFGIQYHPESSPGPEDSMHLFSRFIQMITG